MSDHFRPWTEAQGQSPFVWSTLAAVSQRTGRIPIGTVTCPILRVAPTSRRFLTSGTENSPMQWRRGGRRRSERQARIHGTREPQGRGCLRGSPESPRWNLDEPCIDRSVHGQPQTVPELPDVEGFRRIADRHVVGRRIDSFEVLDAGVLRNARRTRPANSQWLASQRDLRDSALGVAQRCSALEWVAEPRCGARCARCLMRREKGSHETGICPTSWSAARVRSWATWAWNDPTQDVEFDRDEVG